MTVLRVVCCGQIVLWSAASRKKKPAPLLGAMYRRGLVHARVVYATLIHRDDCAVAARVSPRPSIARGGACRHAAAGSVAQKEARAAGCYDVAAHRRRIAISSYYIAIVTKQAFFDRLPMKLMVLGIVCVDPVRKAY